MMGQRRLPYLVFVRNVVLYSIFFCYRGGVHDQPCRWPLQGP
jgi:hypothetical protein